MHADPMKNETWYELKLGQTVSVDRQESITRVPGGWIFSTNYDGCSNTVTFIPFDNEFMEVR